MDDLISRSALLERLDKVAMPDDLYSLGIQRGVEHAKEVIAEAPAVDAVEVVRCKDCAWCKKPFPVHFPHKLECMRFDMEVAADEFCSRSERRADT